MAKKDTRLVSTSVSSGSTTDGSSDRAVSAHASDLLPIYLQRYDRPHTRRAYTNDLTRFFATDEISLDQARSVTFIDINRYLGRLEAEGLKPSTIQRRISALRGFFDWLMALGMIEQNPAHRKLVRRVHAVSFVDRPMFVLTADQAGTLLQVALEQERAYALRDYAMLMVMLHCVLRRSEVAAMNVEHVRPLGRYYVIDLPLSKGGADQYVKILDHVVEVVDEMRTHYGISSGPLWRSFSGRTRNQRLSPDGVYQIVRRLARAAGLPDTGAHTLRHTGCTLAIEGGATIPQVQSLARHKKSATTMAYIHQRDRLRDSAADFIRLPGEPK